MSAHLICPVEQRRLIARSWDEPCTSKEGTVVNYFLVVRLFSHPTMYNVRQSDTVDSRSPLPSGLVFARPTWDCATSVLQLCLGSSLSTVTNESRLNLRIVTRQGEVILASLGECMVTQPRQHKLT